MLHYVNAGTRFYGTNPVYPQDRGRTEFQLIASGTAHPWYDGPEPAPPPAPAPCLWIHAKHNVHGWQDTPGRSSEIAVFHYSNLHPLLETLLARDPVLSLPVTPGEAQSLIRSARRAKTLLQKNTPAAVIQLEQTLLDLTLIALRAAPPSLRPHTDARAEQRVEEACSLYIERIHEAPALPELARAIGLSAPHLRRLFLQTRGQPPKAVFTEIRMNLARHRLRHGAETISELSDRLGFSEPSAFSRAYTAYFGHPPSSSQPADTSRLPRQR